MVECWDGSCAGELADCPIQTCMDTECSLYIDIYTCPEIENNYGYDCTLCEEEGLCLLSCEDEGYITCPNGDCANSESECNTCENPETVYEGINASSGHDEYFLTAVAEAGFLTVSTAGAGIDTKFFIYSACENVDIDNFPYGEYIGKQKLFHTPDHNIRSCLNGFLRQERDDKTDQAEAMSSKT